MDKTLSSSLEKRLERETGKTTCLLTGSLNTLCECSWASLGEGSFDRLSEMPKSLERDGGEDLGCNLQQTIQTLWVYGCKGWGWSFHQNKNLSVCLYILISKGIICWINTKARKTEDYSTAGLRMTQNQTAYTDYINIAVLNVWIEFLQQLEIEVGREPNPRFTGHAASLICQFFIGS